MLKEFETLVKEAQNMPSIDPEMFYAHAFAHYQAGRTKDAAEVFHILCARFPLEARFWFGLASSCQESADYEIALHAWAMSALLDPKNPYPHFHAAECSTSLQCKRDALLALETAKTLLDSETHPLASPIAALEERWKNA